MTIRWRPGEDAILRTDDIEAILELKRSRRAIYLRRHRLGLPRLELPPVRRSLRYWSPAEDAAVLAVPPGTLADLAALLGRTAAAVRQRASRLRRRAAT